jgi:hypothetical protein
MGDFVDLTVLTSELGIYALSEALMPEFPCKSDQVEDSKKK